MQSNSYPPEKGWPSSGVNMGMPAPPANFQNIHCGPNFSNSTHLPQNNFNQSSCPPYDTSRQTNAPNMYHASANAHGKSTYHQVQPNSTLQNTFGPCQPVVDSKNNFYSNGTANYMPFPNHQPFQNNNFQQFPSTVPSQPPNNLPPYLPSPMYNVPPPMQNPGTNGSMNSGLPQQNGQFRCMPHTSNQPFQISYSNTACNPPNQPTFNNANMMHPPPTICNPPPYSLHLQPTPMKLPPTVAPIDVAPKVSLQETKLTDYLRKFQVGKAAERKSDFTVVEYRSSIKKGLMLSKMLRSKRSNLLTLLESSGEEWEVEMKQVVQIQNELSRLCNVLSDSSNLSAVQRKLKLIKKKRERKRKLKEEAMRLKLIRETDREALSQEIDKWLDTINEKNLKQKREIEMKKEADNISAEVRRKIHEAKKTIEKLKLFEKLRSARQANAEKKGLFVSPDQTAHFDSSIGSLRQLMQSQLCDYEAEERALRVMLEEEHEGKMEEALQWRVRKRRVMQQKRQEAVVECLFGAEEEVSPENPLFLFFQHHNSGNNSIENLIQIRHHWDVHLSDDGDPIPHQWVVPIAASNPSWEEVCKD